MSTEDQNRAIVTLKKGVDTELFVNEMLDAGYELYDEKPGSKRNFDFIMTREQSNELKNDNRVMDVRFGSKKENGIFLTRATSDSNRSMDKTSTVSSSMGNWGIASCTTTSDPFLISGVVNSSIDYEFPYTLTGKNVDMVIQDSGVDPNHPEFIAQDGVTNRYQTVDWPTISGLSGTYTQPANYHRDIHGHGTHVAGTATGRLYGWAKNANIYSLKILDDPGNTFGVSASFNMLRNWHNSKTNGIPTIVNMSWGYFATYTNIIGGNYRGTIWAGTTMQSAYGMIQGQADDSGNFTFPLRVSSVDADIQDCLDDGIIMVSSAGNGSHKIDVEGGLDYDNYFTSSLYGNLNYHRGSTPTSQPGVICVGNISWFYNGTQEQLFNSSEKGPRVDIQAPGGLILSSLPTNSVISNSVVTDTHPNDSNYIIGKISGTSMASPQVAGILATILEARPTYTQTECLNWLNEVGELNRLYDPTTGTPSTDYNNYRALQGAKNLYLKTPFVNTKPYSVS